MAGKIKQMLDNLIEQRSKGNSTVATALKTKLLLKGVDYVKYSALSDDDPAVMQKINDIAKEMGITIK